MTVREAIPEGRTNDPRLFRLLVLQVALVGALVGTERAVVPLLAREQFGVASATVALAFILGFGLAKAPMNYAAGRLADRHGRKPVLVAGWLLATPIPGLIAFAPSWGWVIAANVLLGAQQGLCWSTSLLMKIDIAAARRRGVVIGLNEAVGYSCLALTTFSAAALAGRFGLQVAPFVLSQAIVVAGLWLAWRLPVGSAAARSTADAGRQRRGDLRSWRFAAVCQAGLATKVTDVAAWGVVPLVLSDRGLSITSIGLIAAAYPAVWGVLQPLTGAVSDAVGRDRPIVFGLLTQSAGLALFGIAGHPAAWTAAVVILGLGTAFVYPALLNAAVSFGAKDARGRSLGAYRFWRDCGFVIGALVAGALVDHLGDVAALTLLAAGLVCSAALAAHAFGRVPARRGGAYGGSSAAPDVAARDRAITGGADTARASR